MPVVSVLSLFVAALIAAIALLVAEVVVVAVVVATYLEKQQKFPLRSLSFVSRFP
jgi:hypothetical protein